MEIVDIKKNIYIAYKSETSRYLAYIFYLNLHKRKNLNVFYDKATIESSDAWKEILNNSLYKSNVCLIIGEKGSFDSLKKEKQDRKQDNDEFLNEVSSAIEKRKEKQSELLYLAVEGYVPWKEPEFETIPCIQELKAYQGLAFHFKDRNESQIKEDIKRIVRTCEVLCNRGFLKYISPQSSFVGSKSKIQEPKREDHL